MKKYLKLTAALAAAVTAFTMLPVLPAGAEDSFDEYGLGAIILEATPEEIQAAREKYGLAQFDGGAVRLFLELPDDSLAHLGELTNILYDPAADTCPDAEMITQGLYLSEYWEGFTTVSSPECMAPRRNFTLDGTAYAHGWDIAVQPMQTDSWTLTPEETAILLACLDKYAEVPFGVRAFPIVSKYSIADGGTPSIWYWGTDTGDAFIGMQRLDDKGMLQRVLQSACMGKEGDPYEVCTFHFSHDRLGVWLDDLDDRLDPFHSEGDALYVVAPRMNCLRFVLRSDLDTEAAEKQAAEILRRYYPGLPVGAGISARAADAYCYPLIEGYGSEEAARTYELIDKTGTQTDETADAIRRDLAAAGLIEAFYGWGGTANYQAIWGDFSVMHGLGDTGEWQSVNAEKLAQMRAWLAAQYPAYSITEKDGKYVVTAPENASFADRFEAAAALYEQFVVIFEYSMPEILNSPMSGSNALLLAGDVDLSGAVDLRDAVLLAKAAAGYDVSLTAAGRQNADLDGAAGITAGDLTVLLCQLAG